MGLPAGIDNLSLDNRKFHPSQDDIEHICRFFSIGKLKYYEKEKGIIVSHTNFFIFVATTHGEYALKFYSKNAAPKITIEYALNRILAIHHFPTPQMYAGHDNQPFLKSNDLLATCYSYINGVPAWQKIKQRNTIPRINAAMLSLKNILAATNGRVPFLKEESLVTRINHLIKASRDIAPEGQKETIGVSLLDAYRTYQQHQPLFTRQWLHNNTTLTNLLIYKNTVYTLDLEHVREDYSLCDLANMFISCILLLDIPAKTIKTIVKDYFSRHKMDPAHFLVLNALIKVGLIKEYFKHIKRERSIELPAFPSDIVRTYKSLISARKRSITGLLKDMNDAPGFII